ncbi:MAG: cellobiose phosphorylase, partial [Actinotalea sp.]|nr:cellobiose phosphorylase [Actinotalea sp.]
MTVPSGPPWVLASPGGLRAVLVDGGAPASVSLDGLELVQHPASVFEAGLLQLWLRDRGTDRAWPLLGAGSGGLVQVDDDVAVVTGHDDGSGLAWRVSLRLHPSRPAWAWHVEVRNPGTSARDLDVVHTHDVALSLPGALRANELYVSQYLDVRPLPSGGAAVTALAVRQNLPQAGAHPWCVLTASRPVAAWATDAVDVVGLAARSGRRYLVGDLPSRRRQHEHTLAALQTETITLGPGEDDEVVFAGLVVPDHPTATSDADQPFALEALTLARANPPDPLPDRSGAAGRPAPRSAYDPGDELRTRSLSEDELRARWPGPWRAVERGEEVLSFFTADDEHVVTRAKELRTLRPHGTILRTGATARPDPRSLTTTAWMTGSPLSYLTRGHASAGRVVTTVRGYLGLHRAYGVRVFVEVGDRWRLLDLPSTFAMTLDTARWVHALEDGSGTVEVTTTAPADDHRVRLEVRATAGPERRVLLALHLASDEDPLPGARAAGVDPTDDGVVLRLPRDSGRWSLRLSSASRLEVGDDGALFADGTARGPGTVTLLSAGAVALDLEVEDARPADGVHDPALAAPRATATRPTMTRSGWWADMTAVRVAGGPEVEPLAVTLPWLVRDALVHHLAPRGLEQYTGGAWGTRDVTQGPLELLLALDRQADARALLLSVFGAQNPDGTWPQAFGFLPGDEHFRLEPSHGDVVHWPVLALGRYLLAWNDASILDEPVPWYVPPGSSAAPASLLDHVLHA